MNHPPASTAAAFGLLADLEKRFKLVGMDIVKMLDELRDEKARLEELILAAGIECSGWFIENEKRCIFNERTC